MTDALTVPKGESGAVRVFAIDLPDDSAQGFAADFKAIGRALGAEGLDPEYVDVFPVSRVAPLGLSTYLSEGHGIPPEDLAPDEAALEALDGHVAVVTSGAFRGAAQTLTVAPPLRLVGTWREDRAPVVFGDLPAGESETPPPPALDAPKPKPFRQGRSTSRLLAILILVVAIVGFIILNGGR